MNAPDTLRAAAHALNDRTNFKYAPALAGLLQNRADDTERKIVIWQRARQDAPALVEKHYGMYLAVARTVLSVRRPTRGVANLRQPHKTPFQSGSLR